MRRKGLWIAVLILTAIDIVVLLVCARPISGQARAQHRGQGRPASAYDPYPPGLLPSNLNSEIARVLRESDVIEGRALARWHALEPPTLTGQPPVLQNAGTETIETLGELMNYDKKISPIKNESCAFAICHTPALADRSLGQPDNDRVSWNGSFPAAKRTAQRYTYRTIIPRPRNTIRSRACFRRELLGLTRYRIFLRVPDAEQAQDPPVDALEMGFPDTACVAFRLSAACTDLSLKRYGARVRSTSSSPTRPKKSVKPWRGCCIRRDRHSGPAEPGGSHPSKYGL